MPRTKVVKSSKRNREKETSMSERLREYDAAADQVVSQLEQDMNMFIERFHSELNLIKSRLSKKILSTTLEELFSKNNIDSINSSRFNGSVMASGNLPRQKSRDDEGYLTEESSNLGSVQNAKPSIHVGRTPGPLNSARLRRSRSACDYYQNGNTIKSKPSAVPHSARAKMRTPQPTPRGRAFSDDREIIPQKLCDDGSLALYRWPKPGETIISLCGSPVVSQIMPDLVANVNIPIQNGVLSLRPKKMVEIDRNFVQKINPETLKQIKQLQTNLNHIMRYAENPERL